MLQWKKSKGRQYVFFQSHPGFAFGDENVTHEFYDQIMCKEVGDALHLVVERGQRWKCPTYKEGDLLPPVFASEVPPFVMFSLVSLTCSATSGKTVARTKKPIASSPGSSNNVEGDLPRVLPVGTTTADGSEVLPRALAASVSKQPPYKPGTWEYLAAHVLCRGVKLTGAHSFSSQSLSSARAGLS